MQYKLRTGTTHHASANPSQMAFLYSPPSPPPTKLGRYRTLSPPCRPAYVAMQLDSMSIGDKWQEFEWALWIKRIPLNFSMPTLMHAPTSSTQQTHSERDSKSHHTHLRGHDLIDPNH
ncbi:hypothetical protein EDB92DRAFT_867385 [Lactarius akahatsu]|uniref:Uncharacterized protein n=1 Tax=Lactarius akahatsu TaxID=416441 RepID=A0AAD4LF63_9AGAM|nr:hypothetical protein EDB92DRAFT_867385 [Lactarius akahatsu]